MKYDEENWIKVYTRDTAGWLSVSWQARGLSLEIGRKLPKKTGELSLGRKGLEALGALLRAPWAEIEPFVRELIEDGRLVYDAERQTISDPQHADRQTAITSDAERQRRLRERKVEAVNDVTACHAPSRAVTQARDDVTPPHEEKRREEKEEIPLTPQGDPGRVVDQGTPLALEVEETYQRSVAAVTKAPFALTGRSQRADLFAAVNKHAPKGPAPEVLAWLAERVAAWVVPRLDAPEYAGNFAPKHFLGWLNAGARSPVSQRRATGTDEPMRPSRRSLDGWEP
jgi:hypothetical protein